MNTCFAFSNALTEEALAEIVGFSTAHDVWLTLETTFNHKYKTREIHLKDELQSMKRTTRSATDFARVFKGFCDQLHTIGRPVDNTDKVHWFLCGLGAKFSSFSSAQMALTPLPSCGDLVSRAKSYELFQKSFEPVASPMLLLTSLSQVATGNGGINHTGGPILDSNLAPLDSSPVISTQPRTQLWPSTSPSTLPYIQY